MAKRQVAGADRILAALALERKKGFQDAAVFGGLARLVVPWLRKAARAASSTAARARLERLASAFSAYRELDPIQRRALVESLEAALTGRGGEGKLSLDSPVSALPGIGPKRAAALARAGILTVEDLLLTAPVSYLDAGNVQAVAELVDGQRACVRVKILEPPRLFRGRRASRVEVLAADETGKVLLQWFNQPYRAEQMAPGDVVKVLGRARQRGRHVCIVVARLLWTSRSGEPEPTRPVPVYRDIEGIGQRTLQRAIHAALEELGERLESAAPDGLAKMRGLMPRSQALRALHFPETGAGAERARRSLAYEQALALQVRLLQHRLKSAVDQPASSIPCEGLADRIQTIVPFPLTRAQRRVIGEIEEDLRSTRPALRLVHGDVGCGKTVVAAAALLAAVDAGRQAALMAPTELLAEQHALRLSRLLSPAGVSIFLVTGSMAPDYRRAVADAASSGRPAIFVGTHALFQEQMQFGDLAVAVIDEQHRFGVAQRAALQAKGDCVNTIVMSATPIPRTLALALYADFDVSVIDELPPGRKPVRTLLLGEDGRQRAYEAVRKRVELGQQAFVVCPLIEPSEKLAAQAAKETYRRLATGPLVGLRVGLVHGRMPTYDRQAAMAAFYDGEIDVLVATTVIEVGVDVPRASVMVVESAERLGLAQLHQLRGRVARSAEDPICLLICTSESAQAWGRLRELVRCSDGFAIAEADLRWRGPGELAGLRQHGLTAELGHLLLVDSRLVAAAHDDARRILEADPGLEKPEHRGLRRLVEAMGPIDAQRWSL